MGGPEMALQTPQRASRPGEAVARLDHRRRRWGPEMARQLWWGAPKWPPKPPSARRAPAKPWRASITVAGDGAPRWAANYGEGPRAAPPPPPAFVAPRRSRGAPRSPSQAMGPRDGAAHSPALVAPRRSRGARRLLSRGFSRERFRRGGDRARVGRRRSGDLERGGLHVRIFSGERRLGACAHAVGDEIGRLAQHGEPRGERVGAGAAAQGVRQCAAKPARQADAPTARLDEIGLHRPPLER